MIEGCVAAMDGILIKIQVPRRTEVGNVKAFFSGHYHAYGLNIQVSAFAWSHLFQIYLNCLTSLFF